MLLGTTVIVAHLTITAISALIALTNLKIKNVRKRINNVKRIQRCGNHRLLFGRSCGDVFSMKSIYTFIDNQLNRLAYALFACLVCKYAIEIGVRHL